MKLGCYKSKIFGKTQLNLLSIKSLPEDNIEGVLPDYCVVTIEIRPASRKVNLSLLKKLMKKFCKKQKIKVKFKVLRDFPLVYVSPKKLNLLIQAIKKVGETEKFADIKLAGFNDARIITAKFGIPVVNFGPYGEGNHTPEEWVSVKSVQKTKEVYKNLIEIYS